MKATFSERVVAKVAAASSGGRANRRSFLMASVLAGTAFAADPWGYLTRPASAASSICGSGSACNEGWSVFCCTINGGRNSCPPNSFVGGWWKADRSGFCCGNARYYIDCNAFSGSSAWRCHCNTTTCDQRRVACNQFRYGQCNQQIGPYGPVVCRIVTCTPPWQFDRSCTATSATDNLTASHSAPCAPKTNCSSPIAIYYAKIHGSASALGKGISPEGSDATGGRYQYFEHGMITWHAGIGAHALLYPIAAGYRSRHGTTSPLGYPITDTMRTVPTGWWARFQHGSLIWSAATGARALWGPINDKYLAMGGTKSPLGFPVTDNGRITAAGWWARFQHGAIVWTSATRVHAVWGRVGTRYIALGGTRSSLGCPTTDMYKVSAGYRADFQHGSLIHQVATGRVIQLP